MRWIQERHGDWVWEDAYCTVYVRVQGSPAAGWTASLRHLRPDAGSTMLYVHRWLDLGTLNFPKRTPLHVVKQQSELEQRARSTAACLGEKFKEWDT